MQISYTNLRLETGLIWANFGVAVLVVATFVSLFGFNEPLIATSWLYTAQTLLLTFYILEKIIRTFNAEARQAYWRVHWYEILLWIMLVLVILGREGWETWIGSENVWHFAVGFYLVLQVVIKVCRTTVHLAALGRNPMRILIFSFMHNHYIGSSSPVKESMQEVLAYLKAHY